MQSKDAVFSHLTQLVLLHCPAKRKPLNCICSLNWYFANKHKTLKHIQTRQSRIADLALGNTVVRESNNSNTTCYCIPQFLQSERVHCWRPPANELKVRRQNPFCPLVSHCEYTSSLTTHHIASHVQTWRHPQNWKYITYCIVARKAPSHSQASKHSLTCNMSRKSREVWKCRFWDMRAEIQTHGHTHCNTSQPYRGGRSNHTPGKT